MNSRLVSAPSVKLFQETANSVGFWTVGREDEWPGDVGNGPGMRPRKIYPRPPPLRARQLFPGHVDRAGTNPKRKREVFHVEATNLMPKSALQVQTALLRDSFLPLSAVLCHRRLACKPTSTPGSCPGEGREPRAWWEPAQRSISRPLLPSAGRRRSYTWRSAKVPQRSLCLCGSALPNNLGILRVELLHRTVHRWIAAFTSFSV